MSGVNGSLALQAGPAMERIRVVIVGGGPAGTTTALSIVHHAPELASQVVVLEKARYPREKPCAGAMGGRGDALLAGLGVAIDVPSVVIDGISVRTRAGAATVSPGAVGRVVRRIEFDHALARAARTRGVRVLDGVAALEVSDEGASGVRVATSAGTLRADVVVGCDGVGSLVRRSLGVSAGALRAQVIEVDTEGVAGDPARNVIHFDAFDRELAGYAWDFPTLVEGEALVCRGLYRVKAEGVGGQEEDLGALLDARLAAQGARAVRGREKRYAERGFDRVSRYADGARMLVGEAAGIDALTGEGIAQAIEYGVLAGRFLSRALRHAPQGPVEVGGWHDELRRSRLARDLGLRARILRLYHGRFRDEIEGFFADCPEALLVGAEHFAARPAEWGTVAHVAALAGARLTAAGLGMLLRR